MIKIYRALGLASLLSLALFACNSTLTSQTASTPQYAGKLPLDPKVIKGQLDNGLRYIIRKNNTPENRAELRLVVNAGSVLEDDNQQGFAHFVEHMAFNGTTDFNKHQILDYIESIGMKFGSHLNASTSFDNTIYKLKLPTDTPEALEKGFHILENWAHKVSFEPAEIDKERGVIMEELRRRQSANQRVFEQTFPTLFQGSAYGKRLPIGKAEVINHGSHQDLIRFYQDWYRPNLMSIVAVGDFDVKQIESYIKKYFAPLSNGDNKPRSKHKLAPNQTPIVSIATDAELLQTSLTVQIKQPLFEPNSYSDFNQQLQHLLFTGMLNSRLEQLTLTPDTAIGFAGVGFSRTLGQSNSFGLSLKAKPNKSKQAFAELLTEVERVKQHGFTASEFKRQQQSLIASFEKSAKEAEKTHSRSYAQRYINHFTKDKAIMATEHSAKVAKYFLSKASLAQVNSLADKWLTAENRLIALTAPNNEQASLPSEQELLASWSAITNAKHSPYVDKDVGEQLMSYQPKAGAVVAKEHDPQLDIHTWTLSNGVKVLLKKTDFKKDQILMRATSEGGFSLQSDQELESTYFANNIGQFMGLGELNFPELRKFMKGKKFKLSTSIKKQDHSISGSSSVKDLALFFQALHLRFQAVNKDPLAFKMFVNRGSAAYKNKDNSPQAAFGKAIRQTSFANDPRALDISSATFAKQDFESSLAFYQQRFDNPKSFNFVFVGNIDLAQMELLLGKYLASIKTDNNVDQRIDLPDRRTKGKLKVSVKKGSSDKATLVMRTFGDHVFSHEANIKFKAMTSILRTKLREHIREEKSGAYSVNVKGLLLPRYQRFYTEISLTCDPARVTELIAEINKVSESMKTAPVAEKYINNYVKQDLKQHEERVKINSYWLNYLTDLASSWKSPLAEQEYKQLLSNISAEQIQQATQKYFNQDDSLVATLLPES